MHIAASTRNAIPFITDVVAQRMIPIGNHIIAAPNSGTKDASISVTESSSAAGIPNASIRRNDASPWYNATRM